MAFNSDCHLTVADTISLVFDEKLPNSSHDLLRVQVGTFNLVGLHPSDESLVDFDKG